MSDRKLMHTESRHDVLIIEFDQKVTQFADTELLIELDQVLQLMTEAKTQKVAVNLHQLSYFGSLVLEALRRIWTVVDAQEGQMVLCHVTDVSLEVLQIARFDTLWPIFDTVDAALAHLTS